MKLEAPRGPETAAPAEATGTRCTGLDQDPNPGDASHRTTSNPPPLIITVTHRHRCPSARSDPVPCSFQPRSTHLAFNHSALAFNYSAIHPHTSLAVSLPSTTHTYGFSLSPYNTLFCRFSPKLAEHLHSTWLVTFYLLPLFGLSSFKRSISYLDISTRCPS